jgi:hypothetical protein
LVDLASNAGWGIEAVRFIHTPYAARDGLPRFGALAESASYVRPAPASIVAVDTAYLTKRFAGLSDDQLIAIVGKDRDDYAEEALELAWHELHERGIERAAVEGASRPGPEERVALRPAALGEGWLDLYAALAGVSAIGSPLAAVILGSHLTWLLMLQLPLSALQGAVAYGLRKRRLWGWRLNWALLVVVPAASLLLRPTSGVLALVWSVLNGVYFAKRRRLFVSAKRPTGGEG